ncbi:winged helix-turn-helix domain-containing protein [Caproicibacterium sp. BJN0003]|uniref:winged helix-turn-helix domain-containing protein n=1 Tax=Caproicibacterium sp. BJN0003 TaxID=2994078 RepID=UPI00224F5714|nr:winged helix-turn-helix domain-containing protein [Caproicibacterium sp. BJN0003]UZT81302.1 winged helix-turn-helix domain-containing protein [Caproicibacterium sp. BJN0003]
MEPFKVTMFGEFSVCWKNHWIVEAGTRLNKPFEVLILLFQKRDLRISNEELMNRLWNEDSKADNPAGALKSAVYLLRKLLKKQTLRRILFLQRGNSMFGIRKFRFK